jgi:hypothetical protein
MPSLLRKIIIDTDPGHDDALAILLLEKSELFDIKAITTVAGNSTIECVEDIVQDCHLGVCAISLAPTFRTAVFLFADERSRSRRTVLPVDVVDAYRSDELAVKRFNGEHDLVRGTLLEAIKPLLFRLAGSGEIGQKEAPYLGVIDPLDEFRQVGFSIDRPQDNFLAPKKYHGYLFLYGRFHLNFSLSMCKLAYSIYTHSIST